MRAPVDDRVGPNAITRTYEALLAHADRRVADEVFAHAGIAHYVPCPPTRPVPVTEFRALVAAAHRLLGREAALRVLEDAGRRVGRYVLENRIPRVIRLVLPHLPTALATRILFSAMRRNAWTFAGHAPVQFDARAVVPSIEVRGAPTASISGPDAGCGFYAAAFGVLISALVSPAPHVREVCCAATGATMCRFELRAAA
jgi:divinyl protochlorophyllide a 8-vinyl-reductase